MFGVGVRAGNSLPVRKLTLAVLVLAMATFLGVFAVAQAQAADGTMTGVTLASGSPGTLVVSWNAPSPAPTDYRVRWAPVESDYLSWKDDNETDRGNAYPAAAATSLTLSGLSEGTEFKVQARARYHKGEHKDSPWSGPWAEASALVMSQPPNVPNVARDALGARDARAPSAPNLVGIAVTPAGQVLLSWQNPSDDSITGYQVLRGPDADSLAVIEEDTGSSGTSYTDTAPPAGQTHTYAVKARNAAGLSPLSNTFTATVPASETEEETVPASEGEEEELITSQQNQELFLVSNLDTSGLGFQIGQQQPITARYAQSFSAANNADGATAEFDFYGITVVIGLSREEVIQIPGNDLVVTLNSDESGRPGNLVYTLTSPPTIATSEIGSRFTFTAPPGSTLSSGVTYWLKIETAADSTYFDRNYALWYFTSDESEVQGPATENRWSIADTSLWSRQELLWRTESRSMKMAVHGLQRLGPLVSNLGQLDDDLAIIGTNLQAAQSFVAGPDPAGFGYRFQGIRVAASSHVLGGDVPCSGSARQPA